MRRRGSCIIFLLSLFVMADAALGCRTGDGGGLIAFSGEIARGYGSVGAVVLAGVFYLQVRRAGFTKLTLLWFGLLIPIYLFNPGWHYSGIRGDCGTEEASSAHQMMLYIGALFAYQVAAMAGLLWKQKYFSARDQAHDEPPLASP